MRTNLKKTLAFILSAVILLAMLPAQVALAATEPSISLGSATLTGGNFCYTNATVSGAGIQTIFINFSDTVTSGDAITLPTLPTGFTVSTTSAINSYTKRININTSLTGTENATAVQNYVRGIGFSVASATQTVNITITTQNIQYDTFYNIDTQHYYQYISDTSSSWTTAYAAAKGMTYFGRTGYLATITTKDEDTYVNTLSDGKTGWLGGTILKNSGIKIDAANETTGTQLYYFSIDTTAVVSTPTGWYWACGPEIGEIFYSHNTIYNFGTSGSNDPGSSEATTSDTSNTSKMYYNWARGTVSYEPNNRTNTVTDPNYFETCLTTLKIDNNTGEQGTTFSWNDAKNTAAGDGIWFAKGYFVEYGDKLLGDSKTGTAVIAYASDKGTLHTSSGTSLTINTYTDNTSANVSGNVELWKGGVYSATASPSGIGYYSVLSTSLTSGTTYEIYINSLDTGKSLTYSGSAASIDVDYYTVTFSASNAGTASGSSISATAGGATITNVDTVLSGKTVVITAAGAGASTYTYAWSGTGTSGETTAAITISSLSGAVNAACAVTGTTSPTSYSISLNTNGGAISSGSSITSYTYGVGATLPTNVTKTGCIFSGWYDNAGFSGSPVTAIGTSDNGDKAFYARWNYTVSTTTSYTITSTAGDGGSISPSGSVRVAEGSSKTFAITADKGCYISDVLVDGVSVGAASSYTFSAVGKSHTIKAVFAKVFGLSYYFDGSGNKIFIGFATDSSGTMKYIAPEGRSVLFAPNPKEFVDISGHWAKSYISFVTEREIFVGTDNNVFSPDTGMTRAMLATVIGRLYERSYGALKTASTHTFADCDYSNWYGSYIDWCSENGIIQGVGGGMFQPDRQVTRQEMTAMLYRFAEFMKLSTSTSIGETLSYSDASSIATWAQSAALYCQHTGIITGRNDGRFAPTEMATRAEVAVILERFIEFIIGS